MRDTVAHDVQDPKLAAMEERLLQSRCQSPLVTLTLQALSLVRETAELRRRLPGHDPTSFGACSRSQRLLAVLQQTLREGELGMKELPHDELRLAEEEVVALTEALRLARKLADSGGKSLPGTVSSSSSLTSGSFTPLSRSSLSDITLAWQGQPPRFVHSTLNHSLWFAKENTVPIQREKYDSLEKQKFERAEAKRRTLATLREMVSKSSTMSTMTNIDALKKGKVDLTVAISEARAFDISEVDLCVAEGQRRRIHNIIEDLKGAIRVICCFRPMSEMELAQGDTNIVRSQDSMTVEVDRMQYKFDSVCVLGQQDRIWDDCKDLVQSAVDGYNVTIFAYGQTGAGKTYTMFGKPHQPGLAPRIVHEIYRLIAQESAQDACQARYSVRASMLEIYCDELADLLCKASPRTAAAKRLSIRTDKSGGVLVEHLIEEECRSAAELLDVIERGHQQRMTAATMMSSESSRSHLILTVKIVRTSDTAQQEIRGKILMLDLAGCERLKKSQATGHTQKEAIEINKSLTALADVMEALTQGLRQVPYRNHKLTQVMQDSLGKSAKTLMLVNCSPASSNSDETHMSMKYATRAKKIVNTASVNSRRVTSPGAKTEGIDSRRATIL